MINVALNKRIIESAHYQKLSLYYIKTDYFAVCRLGCLLFAAQN